MVFYSDQSFLSKDTLYQPSATWAGFIAYIGGGEVQSVSYDNSRIHSLTGTRIESDFHLTLTFTNTKQNKTEYSVYRSLLPSVSFAKSE